MRAAIRRIVTLCLQLLLDMTAAKEPLPPPLAEGALPLPPLPAVGHFQFDITMRAAGQSLVLYVAVASAEVEVFVVVMDISGSSVAVAMQRAVHFGRAPPQLAALSLSVLPLSNSSDQPPLCVVLAYSSPPSCTVVVDERCGSLPSRSTCAANTTGGSVTSSSIAGVDLLSRRAYVLAYSMSHERQVLPGRGGHVTALAVSVYGAVVLSSAAGDEEDDGTWVEEGERFPGAGEPAFLSAGDNPSLALLLPAESAPSLSSVAFLLTHDSGYCPNSEANNKRADEGVCDISPASCDASSVLNYAYGSAQALQQLLLQKIPLSPCIPSIVRVVFAAFAVLARSFAVYICCSGYSPHSPLQMFGAFDHGRSPSSCLLPDVRGSLSALAAFWAGNFTDSCSCGASTSRAGALMLDGWSIDQGVFGVMNE
jgi:hypothetical protein